MGRNSSATSAFTGVFCEDQDGSCISQEVWKSLEKTRRFTPFTFINYES
jgi:hypothetical protein